jgi:peptidyl-dipeptidase Dcp
MIAKRKAASKPRPRPSVNALMAKWNGDFAMPPFEKIEARHFKPALEAAFREHKAEIEKIARNPAKPSFANTIVTLEKSGWQLSRVASIF